MPNSRLDSQTEVCQQEPFRLFQVWRQEKASIAFFYRRERQYDDEGLTPEERGSRRQDLETKEVLISFRQYLSIEKDKVSSEKGRRWWLPTTALLVW